MLLEQFDPERKAVINPEDLLSPVPGFPETIVMTFSRPIIDKWAAGGSGSAAGKCAVSAVGAVGSVNGAEPVYAAPGWGISVGFAMAPVGAPGCVGCVEELIAQGARRFVVFGSCGVLRHDLADGHVIVPLEALRDEGTSYHYLPPSDSVALPEAGVSALRQALEALDIPYVAGPVWTTDAFYRETPGRVRRRQEAGCLAVEMECAALAALARFRGVEFAQFLYAADTLAGHQWERRGLHANQGLDASDVYLKIALECAARMKREASPLG